MNIAIMKQKSVEVKLVDLCFNTTVALENIRKANAQVLEKPVLGVSCCLKGWSGEDANAAIEKWGPKMSELLEQYSEVEVDVIKTLGEQFEVSIPHVEEKLVENKSKNVSRADLLKMKLMKK